jgi:hypothetical protein
MILTVTTEISSTTKNSLSSALQIEAIVINFPQKRHVLACSSTDPPVERKCICVRGVVNSHAYHEILYQAVVNLT